MLPWVPGRGSGPLPPFKPSHFLLDRLMDVDPVSCHIAQRFLHPKGTATVSSDQAPMTVPDPFRPSPHTGLLIAALRDAAPSLDLTAGLDMGLGSGTVLAVLGQIGVRRLFGVDIDPAALVATAVLLQQEGFIDQSSVHLGSLWDTLAGERFSVVVANLPQFAAAARDTETPADPEHSPYWSSAGPDGRRFMDPFLAGLGAHLLPGGAAFIAHNVFLGLERTEAILRTHGLVCARVNATSVLLHPQKADMLNPSLRQQGPAVGIHRVGAYEFIDVQVLKITHA